MMHWTRKLLYLILMLSLLLSSCNLTYKAKLKQKLMSHKQHLPNGNIEQIDYVKKLIDYMYEFDQKIRKLFLQRQNDKQLQFLISKTNELHSSKMREILSIYGWITISKFGTEYDRKAWLLVQHADNDPFFQAGVLFILEYLSYKGETDKKNYAYLYDRVASKFGGVGIVQKYGTQVDIIDFNIKLQPYLGSLIEIDKNRGEVGLEPLANYLHNLEQIINNNH